MPAAPGCASDQLASGGVVPCRALRADADLVARGEGHEIERLLRDRRVEAPALGVAARHPALVGLAADGAPARVEGFGHGYAVCAAVESTTVVAGGLPAVVS